MAKRQPKKEPSNPITIYDENGGVKTQYPSELVDVIKSTVAKDATDAELYYFLSLASMYDLNPFMKEIWFAKTKDGEPMIMTGMYGYQKLAKRDEDYLLCTAQEVRENDEFEIEMDCAEIVGIKHKFKHSDRGRIVGAYAYLKTKSGNDLCSYVDFREYNRGNYIWKKNPSAMIKKVAKNDVYKSFVNTNGLNDFESMPKDMSPPKEEIEISTVKSDGAIEVDFDDKE